MIETARSSQKQVLDDVRRALGHQSTIAPPPLESFVESISHVDSATLIETFIAEAKSLGCSVYRVEKPSDVGECAREICEGSNGGVVLSSSERLDEYNLKQHLQARQITVTLVESLRKSTKEDLVKRLAAIDVGITAVEFAIAETGTIVLTSDEEQSLLMSLLPPVHIAVVKSHQIEESLSTVINKLNTGWIGRDPAARSATFISGPSRTSDVELTLSIGVHGPKELHLIISS